MSVAAAGLRCPVKDRRGSSDQTVWGRAHDERDPPLLNVAIGGSLALSATTTRGERFAVKDRAQGTAQKGGQLPPSFSIGRTTKCQAEFSGVPARVRIGTLQPEAAGRVPFGSASLTQVETGGVRRSHGSPQYIENSGRQGTHLVRSDV